MGLTVRETLLTARLGIVGMPEDPEGVCAHCARLGVEPVLLLEPDAALPGTMPHAIRIPSWEEDGVLALLGDGQISGLWSASGHFSPRLGALCSALNLSCLPFLDDAQQAALPIEGATIYSCGALAHLDDQAWQHLPVPAWVRAACTGGDSSCMRLDHPNDLSLASAKLQKRNQGGSIRIQPVVEGPVYRILAFKTGATLAVAGVIAEDVTSSVYRVPLGMSMPVDVDTRAAAADLAARVNQYLPHGWGYVELECIDAYPGLRLIDVQCPAFLDPHLCRLVALAQGVDLWLAAMSCALGREPDLSPGKDSGAAMTWLLTRSGVVTGFKGIEEARGMPGVVEVKITAAKGDILSHVVDIPSRERGGYVIATGSTEREARARLDAARASIWINTSPALM